MFKNYYKVALRNILKNPFYSAINIFGLSVGVLACLFIFLYNTDELSYDTFHKDYQDIYRIGLRGSVSGQEIRSATSCMPLAAALTSEVPGIEEAIRIQPRENQVFKYDEKVFIEKNVIYADSNFFDFFSFALKAGDAKTVLKDPYSVVLTEKTAVKYFGNADVVGKMITVGNGNQTYKVTGIAANANGSSHISFDALISSSSDLEYFQSDRWVSNSIYTYYRKSTEASIKSIDSKLVDLTEKYAGAQIETFVGVTFDKFKEQGNSYGYISYPMSDTHLYSDWSNDMAPASSVTYVYIFTAIGLFILVIACINFMNLSTARSAGRAKEIGLRKTLGSLRAQIAGQFLAESMIYGVIAVLFAVFAAYALLPQFNLLAGKQLSFQNLLTPSFLGMAVGLMVIIGLLAGSYPAFYLTSFNAVEVLKGKVRSGMKSKGVRSGLVVFQFSLSIVLIICTTIVYQQINHMQSQEMGMVKDNVLVIKNVNALTTNATAFANAMTDQNTVESVSFTNNVFPGVNNTSSFQSLSDGKDHIMGAYYADYDHDKVMKLQLTVGRFFSREFPSDSLAIIINEAAARELGYANPLDGEVIARTPTTETKLKVIGVVKNFNFESFKADVRPILIRLRKVDDNLLVRFDGKASEIVKYAEGQWKEYAGGQPFQYEFMDENFDKLFREESRLSVLFSIFTTLAICIACLGLFALASFTAEQRTKEIGVRKALGASEWSIVISLSKEFTILVVTAIFLGAVPAYFILSSWLSQFVYRVDISPWVFVVSGVGALLIAWLTVSSQALRAALSKPVDSLRHE